MPRGAAVQSPRSLALGYEADTLRSGRFADDLSPPRRNAAARDFLDESSLSSSSSDDDPTPRRISTARDLLGGSGTSSSSDEISRPPLRPTAARVAVVVRDAVAAAVEQVVEVWAMKLTLSSERLMAALVAVSRSIGQFWPRPPAYLCQTESRTTSSPAPLLVVA